MSWVPWPSLKKETRFVSATGMLWPHYLQ
jgi:hypothetical protein